VIASSIDFF